MTTTLTHLYFQTINPFYLVVFPFNQYHGKEQFFQSWGKMHEPTLFGLGSNMEVYPYVQGIPHQVEFANGCTNSSKPLNLIPIVPKHIAYGIMVWLKVNLQAKSSQIRKLDPMWKMEFSPKWQKKSLQQTISMPLVVPNQCNVPKPTCLWCKQAHTVVVSCSP